MKYIATIKKLSNDVGHKAAFYYDEQFRMWRAENPAQMPWEKINAELHMEALQVGLKSRLDGQEKTSKQVISTAALSWQVQITMLQLQQQQW